jgi:hypothetical protein
MATAIAFCFVICFIIGAICLVGISLLSNRLKQTKAYPDRPIEPILRLRHLSAKTGWWRISGLLTLTVYSDGFYVGVEPLFRLFRSGRDTFVPWESITIIRKRTILGQRAEFHLAYPEVIALIVPGYVANKLANVAMDRWPESGPFDPVTWRDAAGYYLRVWAVVTFFGGLFFSVLFQLAASPSGPPIWFAFAFPGLFFGIMLFVRFITDERRGLRQRQLG